MIAPRDRGKDDGIVELLAMAIAISMILYKGFLLFIV
jgi:hypothetical protein